MERRVLRLITRLNIGGPGQQALLLARELRARYPTVLAAGRSPAHEGELSDPRVAVHRVHFTRALRPTRDTRALSAVRGLLTSTRPVLVHTHMAKAGALGRIAASTIRPRPVTVHTFHGHVLDGYFSAAVERVFIATERRLARHTDALIAVSEQTRDELLALGIGTPERFHVIPVGLDLSRFVSGDGGDGKLRRRLGVGDETPLVGALGRLTAIKDHATLLQAIALVPGAHLVVLGDGELRADLERDATAAGIGGRVHFTGWWKDAAGAIGDLDVVALTSRNEGTPLSLIEALACARPVVATDVGGVRAVVKDGTTGFVVPPGDPAAVAHALARLLDDRELRTKMGASGRRHVTARFGSDRLIADIGDLYDDLLQSRPSRPKR